jgi:iron complex transport system ATP-binding protein
MTLVAANVEVRYQAHTAVRATSVTITPGELVALVGPNGAGKSSLLKALAGLTPHGGVVTWQGAALAALGSRARACAVAYLPQDPPVHWPLLARDLVALGRLPHRGYGAAPSAADRAVVLSAMHETDTLEFATRGVDRLSVGERARVLLARALAVQAPVLLVDEPIAMLDPYHQLHVMSTLAAYARGDSATTSRVVVVVLHDLGLAARFCGRVLVMCDGAVVADGPPAAALGDTSIRAHYRVEPLISTHDGEPVIVPWRPLRDDTARQN